MKLKLIALAALLASAGVAQAKIADSNDNGNTGSGDLFASLVSVTNTATFTVDLGVRLDQFVALVAPSRQGVKLVWDLQNSSFTDMSAVSTGLAAIMQPLDYGNVYSTFATPGVIGASDLRFDVKAMDGLPTNFPTAGQNRYLSTSTATAITPTNGQVFAMDNIDQYVIAANGDSTNSTHGSDVNTAGASMYDFGDNAQAYYQNSGDNWKGAVSFTSPGTVAGPLNFYLVTNSSGVAASLASVTKYESPFGVGQWNFEAGTAQLSYVAAPVPEAETWAMLLAGLGVMGTVVRRRRNKA